MAAGLPKIQRSLERGTNGIYHFIWNGATFQPDAKMTKWMLNCIFPVMEWSTDTKTGYDDLQVYMEYGYVLISSTGRNNVKMAAFSFPPTMSTGIAVLSLHALWSLTSPIARLFVEQMKNEGSIKAWFPWQRASNTENVSMSWAKQITIKLPDSANAASSPHLSWRFLQSVCLMRDYHTTGMRVNQGNSKVTSATELGSPTGQYLQI